MGIYDRDYYRQTSFSKPWGTAPGQIVKLLIILNVSVFVIQQWFEPSVNAWFSFKTSWAFHSGWEIWRPITYAFCHAGPWHILGNMLFLYFLGRELEILYGPREFLKFYLAGAVIGALCQSAFEFTGVVNVPSETLFGPTHIGTIGASGAVSSVVFLYALHYPRKRILIWGFIPIEMFWLAVIFLVINLFSVFGHESSTVAHAVHLGGAAYGIAYKLGDLRFSRINPSNLGQNPWPRKHSVGVRKKHAPNLRVVRPPEEEVLNDQVDEVLRKISREGTESLTDQERDILQSASQQYKARRH